MVLSNTNLQISVTHDPVPILVEDSHHPALDIVITHISNNSPSSHSSFTSNNNPRYNFRQADYPKLYAALFAIDWSFLELLNNVDIVVI